MKLKKKIVQYAYLQASSKNDQIKPLTNLENESSRLKTNNDNLSHEQLQHSTVQHSTVQYSAVQYSTAQHSTMQHSMVQYSAIQHSAIQHSTEQCNTARYSTAQCNTAQCNTAQLNYFTINFGINPPFLPLVLDASYHQRRCLEAWHINSAHAPLNRDDGGLLPDVYLHLINR